MMSGWAASALLSSARQALPPDCQPRRRTNEVRSRITIKRIGESSQLLNNNNRSSL